MNFPFLKYTKIYYIFSSALVFISVLSFLFFGFNFGIEFTGGSIIELTFKDQRPSNQQIHSVIADLDLGEVVVQPTGENGVILRTKEISVDLHQEIFSRINSLSEAREQRFDLIGPSIGRELKSKTINVIILTLTAISVYIAIAFRKVSKPVSSWKYGIVSLIALCHDIIIPLGVFSVLGYLYNVEITIPIIAALLTILGFSVHDTIVIFDRTRENIIKRGGLSYEETVNLSLNQTIGRSMATSITVLFVLFSLYFFGGQTLKYFSLALIIGIISGAYSSIFIASPLLVTWFKHDQKKYQNR